MTLLFMTPIEGPKPRRQSSIRNLLEENVQDGKTGGRLGLLKRQSTKKRSDLMKGKSLSCRSLVSSQHLMKESKPASYSRIATLILRQKWQELRDYLDSPSGSWELVTECVHEYTEHKLGMTPRSVGETLEEWKWKTLAGSDKTNMFGSLLHLACRSHPPLDIVKKLVSINPSCLKCADHAGRAPVHVAAAWGANSAVVAYLVQLYPDACRLKDFDGRTPMHLHCALCSAPNTCDEPSEQEFPFDTCSKRKQLQQGPIIKVISVLHAACPTAINEEDEDGMNPLQYAILLSGDGDRARELVITMQKMSVNAWRLDKKWQLLRINSFLLKQNRREGWQQQYRCQNVSKDDFDCLELLSPDQLENVHANSHPDMINGSVRNLMAFVSPGEPEVPPARTATNPRPTLSREPSQRRPPLRRNSSTTCDDSQRKLRNLKSKVWHTASKRALLSTSKRDLQG